MSTREFRIYDHRLDLVSGRLTGPAGDVHLRPRAFELLCFLMETAPQIHSTDRLLDAVWGVEHLSAGSVKQAISEIRQAVGDTPSEPTWIETVHGRGYRFVAPVEEIDARRTVPEPVPEAAPQAVPVPEARPPAVSRGAVLAAVVTLVLLAVALGLGPGAPLPEKSPSETVRRPAFAVIGIDDLGGEETWMASAVVEIVTFELAATGALRAVPDESIARLAARPEGRSTGVYSPAQLERLHELLGVDLVVTGSYLITAGAPREFRLQLRVQEVAGGATVAWARESGPPERLADLVTRAARALAESLGTGTLEGAEPVAVFAASTAVLEQYARGRDALARRDAPAARRHLERATELDPDNPLVLHALASALSALGYDTLTETTAHRAVELSEELPRELRLSLEARAADLSGDPERAVELYRALHLLAPDAVDHGLGLAGALRGAGRATEALDVLATLESLPPPDGNDPRIHLDAAACHFDLGDFTASRERAGAALDAARRLQAPSLAAEAHASLGWALHRLGDAQAALDHLSTAETIYRDRQDPGGAAAALLGQASVHQAIGRHAPALAAYRDALPLYRSLDDLPREAATLNNLSGLLAAQGDYEGARQALERSVEVKRRLEDLDGLALSLTNLASVAQAQGKLDVARRATEESLVLHRQLGDKDGESFALRTLGRLLRTVGDDDGARAALEAALDLTRETGNVSARAHCHLYLGDLETTTGRYRRAEGHYRIARRTFTELEQHADVAVAGLGLAEALVRQDRLDEGQRWLDDTLELVSELGAPDLEADGRALAELLAERRGRPRGRSEGAGS